MFSTASVDSSRKDSGTQRAETNSSSHQAVAAENVIFISTSYITTFILTGTLLHEFKDSSRYTVIQEGPTSNS